MAAGISNSVNTNVGAMLALSSLRTTQTFLDAASKQVQTGYRVADAADDQPTADLLTQRMEVHEKNAWMLRVLLEDGGAQSVPVTKGKARKK